MVNFVPGMVKAMATKVALFIQKTSRQSTLGTVTFERLITQVGGIWNRETNNFAVPVRGMYLFHFTLLSENGRATVYLRKDNTNVQAAYSQTHAESASLMVVMEMEAGAQVSCILAQGVLHAAYTYGAYTHLSGALLYDL